MVVTQIRSISLPVLAVHAAHAVHVDHRHRQHLAGAPAAELLPRDQGVEGVGAQKVGERIHPGIHRPLGSDSEITRPAGR
jgi:hypothetical protein